MAAIPDALGGRIARGLSHQAAALEFLQVAPRINPVLPLKMAFRPPVHSVLLPYQLHSTGTSATVTGYEGNAGGATTVALPDELSP